VPVVLVAPQGSACNTGSSLPAGLVRAVCCVRREVCNGPSCGRCQALSVRMR
jgi:hypothetical protein